MRRRSIFWLVGLLAGLSARPVPAAFELRGGLRAMGLGQAYTALSNDGSALFYNPAGLVDVDALEIGAAYYEPFGMGIDGVELKAPFVTLAVPFGNLGTLGAAMSTFDGAGYYSERNMAVGYGVALLDHRLSVGATGRILSQGFSLSGLEQENRDLLSANPIYQLGPSVSAFTVDLGLQWTISEPFVFGAVLQNVLEPDFSRSSTDSDPVPRTVRVGMARRGDLTFAADLEFVIRDTGDGSPLRGGAGLEGVLWGERLTVRAGARDRLNGEGRNTHLASGFSLRFLSRERREPGIDIVGGREFTDVRRWRVFLDAAWDVAAPWSELIDAGYGAPGMGVTLKYDVTRIYEKFSTRQELEDELKKRKTEVAFEVVEDLERQNANMLESERQKIEATLDERLDAEKKLMDQQLEERARLLEEETALQARQQHAGLEEEIEEQVRRLHEVIREKNIVIQRSTRTNEALQHLVKAVGLFFEGDYGGAEGECLIAIEIAPYLALSFTRLGSIYLKQGRAEDAAASWERALEIEPGNAELREWLGALRGVR